MLVRDIDAMPTNDGVARQSQNTDALRNDSVGRRATTSPMFGM
jgi:hypothetical protein